MMNIIRGRNCASMSASATAQVAHIFNENWYIHRYPDVLRIVKSGKKTALQHFLEHGIGENRRPNPVFDLKYLDEVVRSECGLQFFSNIDLLNFFFRSESNKILPTHALFDPSWYLLKNEDVRILYESGKTYPLRHFVEYGASENRAPNAMFDPVWYLQNYPDAADLVAKGFLTAIDHYVLIGAPRGYSPSTAFNTEWYLRQNADVEQAVLQESIDALSHYLMYGKKEGRRISSFRPATVIAPNDLALAVYRGILEREPEASERSALAIDIAQDSSAPGLSAMLHGFVRSEEASQRSRVALASLASPALSRLQDQVSREAVTIVSVGGHCLPAHFLRTMGLRIASYPFDWLFSSFDIVQQCLDTDFADFLDTKYYEPVPLAARRVPNEGYTHHRLYREQFGGPPVFNHHDMTKPEAQAHFVRAVERFRALRQRPAPVIYLGVTQAGAVDPARAAALSRALCRPDLDTFILVEVDVRPVANVADISPCAAEAQGDVVRLNFRPSSPMGGLTFGNLEDDDLLRAILARTFTQVLARTGSKNL